MVRDDLAHLLSHALKEAQRHGDLAGFEVPPIPIERPKQAGRGDFATPVCLQLARLARMAPREIASRVIQRLGAPEYLGCAEIAGAGYINFTLNEAWLARQVETILTAGPAFGNVNVGHGKRVQVEFISANPTGSLTIGSGRNAVLGDGLANVLAAAGYEVQREYYVNDAGTQMEVFGETILARYAQALGVDEPLPEGGYPAEELAQWSREIATEAGDRYLSLPREQALPLLRDLGLEKVLNGIRQDCARLGIHFDRWFSERSLYDDGHFDRIMNILRQGNHLYEKDGAIWFNARALGGDKDEVIIRSNGQPGYFGSDIAYHYNKFGRGFEWVIDVWGADHQGHVPRMKAMMRALGLDPERLTLLIYQLVTILRDGQPVRMGKRLGTAISLVEVLDEIGPDAVRFFLLSRSADSQMELDLELAKRQSSENPVYYVQYAHARIASILRHAQETGIRVGDGDVSLLQHPSELALVRKMLQLPEIVETAALQMAPHHLTYYAQELAAAFHAFYRDCRVVSTDPAETAITQARLKLVQAAQTVLARVLSLMGMSAPEQM
ncbi:MAG: arginine--tRNA ligase [Chloroflexota bacterium]